MGKHYVLKDQNGYVKSFYLTEKDKTVMTKDIQKAKPFRADDVHVKVLGKMHPDLELVEVDLIQINMNEFQVCTKIEEVKKGATSKQVGGNHYKNLAIQPVEYTVKNGLDFLQGNVIKYVTRFRDKNGLQDLQKAKHYIDLLIQFNYIDK